MTQNLDDLFASHPEILTVAEVADLLRMSRPGTYKWIREGVIPAYQLHGSWFIPRDQLKAKLQEGSNAPPPVEGDNEG